VSGREKSRRGGHREYSRVSGREKSRRGGGQHRMMAAFELSPRPMPSENPAPSATTFFSAPQTCPHGATAP
jgi:hypothetical protein